MNFGACFSRLSTSVDITVLDGLVKQESVTTYEWSADLAHGPCIIAYPIQIRTAVDISQTTSTNTITTASQSSTADSSSTSLSAGGIAGIVIGVLVGIALLAAIMWFFLRRQVRRGRPSTSSLVVQQEPSFMEMSQGQVDARGELEGFSGATRQYELAARPAELETSSAQPPPPRGSKYPSIVH
jgi:hypothetical protein